MDQIEGKMSQHPQLPVDIVVEILTWLPVKTLVRFRCVCKSWDVLIQNPKFINLHLSRASADIDRQKVLISLNPSRSVLCKYLDDVDKGLCDANVGIDGVVYNKGNSLVGSCNGLLCVLGAQRNFLVLNPSTGKCREMDIHEPPPISKAAWLGLVGFGFEHTVDDYKIVQAFLLRGDEYPSHGDSVEGLVVIIKVGRNVVEKFKCQIPFIPFQVGRQVSGKLHWVVSDVTGAGKERHRLLSFDLKKDEFQEQVLPFPDHKGGTSTIMQSEASSVSVLHGQLSVFIMYGGSQVPDKSDLWVREEQGGKELWTKKLRFLPKRGFFDSFWLNPVCFSKNGALLMEVEDGLMIYDPKEKEYTKVFFNGFKGKWPCAEVYVESLVSPYHVPFANLTQWS